MTQICRHSGDTSNAIETNILTPTLCRANILGLVRVGIIIIKNIYESEYGLSLAKSNKPKATTLLRSGLKDIVCYTTGLRWSSSSLPLSAERAVTTLCIVGRGCPAPFPNAGGFSISWSCQFRPNRCMAVTVTKQGVQRGFLTMVLKDEKPAGQHIQVIRM